MAAARDQGNAGGYDAFVSYSHALDGRLAPTLRRELERFAKPWYRLRSLRVFVDESCLAANPALWPAIESALTISRWLIVMASPEAAQSAWVDREVSWWLENAPDPVSRLLIVLTSGELAWDERAGDFARAGGEVLPPALHGAFREEPRWVDLRWLRDAGQLDRANPRLRDCVADVAAAVQGVGKDLLVGEHIRQHRRALRLARGGAATLAVLLALAIAATAVAAGQRDAAVANLKAATARQLAALAVANLNNHIDLAQLFAVAGYRMDPDSQTLSALLQAVTASPHLERYLRVGEQVTALAGSADGHVVAAGTADGRLIRWDVDSGALTEVRTGGGKITSIAVSADGDRIVAAGARTYLWNADSTRPVLIHAGLVSSVAVSHPARRLPCSAGHRSCA